MAYQHSIMTDDLEHCYYCGRTPVQFHHIYGGPNRKKATEDDLFIPLCWECHVKVHNEPTQRKLMALRQLGQLEYEKTHTREEFRERYGKSYL